MSPAEARSLKSHGLVAFVRATAHDGDPEDPVAIAQAAFMITKASKAAQERARRDYNRRAHVMSRALIETLMSAPYVAPLRRAPGPARQ